MNIVEWMHFDKNYGSGSGATPNRLLIGFAPEPVYPDLVRGITARQGHTKCPAFIDALSNTFLIRASVDMKLLFNPITREVMFSSETEDNCKDYFDSRDSDNYPEGSNVLVKENYVFSISQFLLFTSVEDIEMELLPSVYHESEFTRKTNLIMGRLNINKWIRPIEIAGSVQNTSSTKTETVQISIKRGDPLCYIRFNPKNGRPVKLKQITDLQEMENYYKLSQMCITVKHALPMSSMEKLYKMFEPYRRKKKCPFGFSK
jgi:hypothetical protein